MLFCFKTKSVTPTDNGTFAISFKEWERAVLAVFSDYSQNCIYVGILLKECDSVVDSFLLKLGILVRLDKELLFTLFQLLRLLQIFEKEWKYFVEMAKFFY